MSEDIEVLNLFVNRNFIYDLSLNNVLDSNNTSLNFSITTNNKYGTTNEPICQLDGNKLIAYNEGICDILGSTTETDLYNKGKSKVKRIIVSKNNQKPLILNNKGPIYFNETIKIDITGGSIANPIILSCDSSSCIINQNKLKFTNTGTYNVKAIKYGNFMYNDVQLIMNLNILPIKQTDLKLSIKDIDNQDNIELNIDRSKTYELLLENYNEKPSITYNILYTSSIDPAKPICKIIDGNKLMAFSEGSCILQATTSATTNYLSTESNKINIIVIKNYQNNILLNNTENLYYKGSIELNPTGGSTKSKFDYEVKDTLNCTLSGNILLGNSAGDCVVSITKEGDEIFENITNDFEIRVNKIKQSNAYVYLLSPTGDYIGKNNDISGNETESSGYQLDDNSSYINVNVNRDISYQLITGNVSDNAIAKYKITPRNMLDNDEYLFYYYTFNYDSVNNISVFNSNYTQSYDATLSVSGLINLKDDIYGPGILSLNNKNTNNQFVKLKSLVIKNQGISIGFWGKMNKSPDKTLFFSFSNGYHVEDIYMGINNGKLFAGYVKAEHVTTTYENILEFPFENLNNDIWHHIVWVILPEGTWKFYLDGYLLESYYCRAYPTQILRKNCFIGNGVNNIWGNLSMSNFRLYNRSLTDNEVKYLCDYTTIYSTLNIGSFYLDNDLETYYNFASYACESLSNLNIIKVVPTSKIFRSSTINITDISGNLKFKNGVYNVKSSSFYGEGYEGFQAFNDEKNNFWATSINGINNYKQDPYNKGIYQGGGEGLLWSTQVTGIGNVSGEWLQIEIPYKIVLKNYSLVIRKGLLISWPTEYVIAGSNNGNDWELVEYKKITTVPNNSVGIFNITSTKDYSFFRLIVIKTNGSNFINLCQWNITGNLLSDLGNINTYRLADISKDGLIYEATLSNKNIIINDNIIDYVELKSQNNDFIKIDEIILKNASGISFCIWLKGLSTQDNSIIFTLNTDLSNTINLLLSGNKLAAQIGKTIINNINNENINDGIWRHIVWTINGNTWKFYINGILVNTITNGAYPLINIKRNNCYIGKGINNNFKSLNGGISDFRIYNRILTEIDAMNLYKFKLPLFFKLNKENYLLIYYPLSYKTINNLQIGNMASGTNVLDGTMSVKDLVLNKSSQYGNNYASFKSELEYLTLGKFTTTNNGLTICFSFQFNSLNNDQVIFEFSDNGKSSISCKLTEFSDSYFKILFTVTRNNYPKDKNNYTRYWIWLPYQEYKRWTHISWNFIKINEIYANWKIYVDGKLYSIFDENVGFGYYYYPESIERKTNYIGKSFLPGFSNFIGSIYDVRIYSKVLTADELKYFSTQRFFPVYRFFNNQLTSYNFGGLYIQAYINSTDNYNFSLSKSLFLNITKNRQPDFKIVSGKGITGKFDGLTTPNNLDGYSIDYFNTPVSGIQPVIAAIGNKLYINSLQNESNNDSFILETYQSSLLFTKGNSIGSKGTQGNIIQSVKIVKVGDYFYNDLTKIYNIWIRRNDRVPFGIILSNSNKINIINSLFDNKINLINIYNIKIDRTNSYKLTLTSNYTIDLKEYEITGDKIDGKEIIQLNNGLLTAMNSGQIKILAKVKESSIWNEGTSILTTINILKENQSELVINEIPKLYYLSSINLNVNGGNSSQAIVLTTNNNDICSINEMKINGLKTGKCKIKATRGEDDFYYLKFVETVIEVLPIDQNFYININELTQDDDKNYIIKVNPDKKYKLILQNIMETPAYINYKPNNNLLRVNNEGFVTALNAGISSVEIELGKTINYNLTKKIINFKIIKNDQSKLNVGHINNLYYQNTIKIDISGGNSANNVRFESETENCTISGDVIGGSQTGDCLIKVTKPEDFMYNNISTEINLLVKPIYQPKLKIEMKNQIISGDEYVLNVDPTNKIKLNLLNVLENPTIFYAVIDETPNEKAPVCKIEKDILIPLNSGFCNIKAITTSTKNYLSTESLMIKVIVNKNKQEPLIMEQLSKISFRNIFDINIKGGSNNNEIILQKQTENCLINNKNVQATKAGSCFIKAIKESDYKYEKVELDINFEIEKIEQPVVALSINSLKPINDEYFMMVNRDLEFVLYVSNYIENPQITFEIVNITASDDVLCIINNNKIIPYNFGKCKIRAVLSETTNYKSSYSNFININFDKYNQEPLKIICPLEINYNSVIFLKSTGGNVKENEVKYTSDNNSVCSITNLTELKGAGSGKCKIKAFKEGNFMYNPVETFIEIEVKKIKQTIKINEVAKLNTIFIEDVEYDLSLNELKENADVKYTIISETKKSKFTNKVCSLNNNKLKGTGAGIVIIKASTMETHNYLATETEPIKITVNQKQPADFIIDNHETLFYGKTITITTDNGQKNPGIVFSCNDPGIKIVDNKFTCLKAAKYVITGTKLETLETSELVKTFILTGYKLEQIGFAITNTVLSYDIVVNGKINITTSKIFENAKLSIKIIEDKPLDINNNLCCIVRDNVLEMINPGYVKIIGILRETENYLQMTSKPVTIVINKRNQNDIVIKNLKDININTTHTLIIENSSSGNPINIKPLSSSCEIHGTTIIAKSITEKCELLLTVESNNIYNSISKTINFKILPTNMPNFTLLNINTSNDILMNKEYDLRVLNVLENAKISYNITSVKSEDQVKYIDIKDNVLKPLGPGKVILEAIASQTNNYLETYSNKLYLNIKKADQELITTTLQNVIDFNNENKFTINGGSTDNPFTFEMKQGLVIEYVTQNIYKIVGVKSGKYIVKIKKSGDDKYNDIEITTHVTVNKIKQPDFSILNFNEKNEFVVNKSNFIPIKISGTKEKPYYGYKITNIKPIDGIICKLHNDNIIAMEEGICTIDAITLETENYLATQSSNTITIKIVKLLQPELNVVPSGILDYNNKIKLVITGGIEEIPTQIVLSNNNIKIVNNIVFGLNAGNTTVTVLKPDTDKYQGIKKVLELKINKIYQPDFKLFNLNDNNTIYVNPDIKYQLKTTPFYEVENVNYEVLYSYSKDTSNNICAIVDNNFIAKNEGECKIRAYTIETSNYFKTYSNELIIKVIKNNQKDLNIICPKEIKFNDEAYLSGIGGNTNNNIIYNTDSSNCIINKNTIKGNYFGKTKITAIKEGDFMYNKTSVEFFVNVFKIKQVDFKINNINQMNEIEVDPNTKYYLTCNNVKESSKIKYIIKSSKSDGDISGNVVCSINDNVLIPQNAGKCVIYAISQETNNYISTTSEDVVINVKLKEAIDFKIDNIPKLFYGQEFYFTVDNGQYNPDISFKPTMNQLVIDGFKLKCSHCGLFKINVHKKGNFMYKALDKEFPIFIEKIPQLNFDILNISQTNHVTKYFEVIKSTKDFYKIFTDGLSDIKYLDKYNNGTNIFIFNKGTTINWTKITGIGFDSIDISSIIKNKWVIIDICPISYIEKTKTMNALITGKNLETNNLIIIKLKGNPTVLESYIPQLGYGNYLINDKNVIVGTFENYYCNIKSEKHFLMYDHGVFKTRQIEGLSNLTKKLNYNSYVPNLVISCIDKKGLIILKDYETYNITKKSSPSYYLPISDINGKSIDGLENSKYTYGSVYILSSQYIFLFCVFDSKTSLLRVDINNKIIKVIYQDTNNQMWGFDVIDINTIIIMNTNNYLLTNNGNLESDFYTYSAINDNYTYTKINNGITWKTYDLEEYFKTNMNYKFYSNDRFIVMKDVGLIFFESLNDLKTYTINKPISVVYNPVSENSRVKLELISSISKHEDKKLCYISKNQIVPLAEGTCTFKAIAEETTNYKITESPIFTINFELLDQSDLNIKNNLENLRVDDNFELAVDGGSTSVPYTAYSLTNNIKIDGYTVSCIGIGEAILVLYKEGNETYKYISKEVRFRIKKGIQNILLNDITFKNELIARNTYELKATGLKPESRLRYNIISTTENLCYVIENTKLYTVTSGVALIEAISTETNNYMEGISNKILLTIKKDKHKEIKFKLSNPLQYGKTAYLMDEDGETDIKYIVETTKVCKMEGNLITAIGTGTCIINGIKEGNNIKETLVQQFKITINKLKQPKLLLNDINYMNSIHINPNAKYVLKLEGVLENANVRYIIVNNYDKDKKLIFQKESNGYIVNANTFVPIKEGYCDIQAIADETTNYLQTFSNKIFVKIEKTDQEKLIITKNKTLNYLGSAQLITIGGNTENEVAFKLNNNNAFMKGNYIFGSTAGKTIVTANKKGNTTYNDISENYEIEILKIKQKFYIQNLNKTNIIFVDENIKIPLKIINLKENPNIQYNIISSLNEGNILIKENILYPLYAGEYMIKAQVSETVNYLASESPELYIKIIKNKQKPLELSIDKPLYYRNSSIIQTKGGNTTFEEKFEIKENNTNCLIKNKTIIGNNVGFCKFLVKKQGDFKYEEITDELFVEILPIPQYGIKLLDVNILNTIVVNPDINIDLKVIGVEENPQIIFKIVETIPKDISNSEVVLINGNKLSGMNEGICKIQAVSLETHNFIETSSNIITIIVNKNYQEPLKFKYNENILFESQLTIEGSGGNNTGNLITYSCKDNNCKIDENTAKFNNIGKYLIKGEKKGNFMYYDIEQDFEVNVKPIKQHDIKVSDVNFENEVEVDLDKQYLLNVSNYKQNPNITFKVIKDIPDDATKKSVCTIDSSNNLVAVNAGKCLIKGYLSSTKNYLETETPEYILSVIKKSPANFTIDKILPIPVKTKYELTINNGTFDPNIYEITCNDRDIKINDNIISSNQSGEYKLYITKKATFEFKALIKKIKITIAKLNQPKIVIKGLETDIFVSSSKSYKLSLNDMYETPFIQFKIVRNLSIDGKSDVCMLINNSLFGLSEGTCYLKVIVNETTNYNYQETELIKITVKRKQQSKLVFNNVLELKVNETIPLNIIGGSSNRKLTIKSKGNNCFINGSNLSGIIAGVTTITATMDGDAEYLPTSTTVKFTIYKNYQNVKLEKINQYNELFVGDIGTLFINNIRESGKIKYIISDVVSTDNQNSICYISNGQIITTGAGSCSIQGIINETLNYYETKTEKIYIKIMKKQQDKLVINGKTSRSGYIKLNTNFNDYNYINIGGGNTSILNVNSTTDKCKIVEIN
jgi:hypothetical protein